MRRARMAAVWKISLLASLVAALWCAAIESAAAQEPSKGPIKIGFSVSLTGGLASAGKAHLLSKQIWAEGVNARGGLLGRQVKLVYYDDQTNAATVPGIYAKLIDAAMPQIMQHKKMVMVLVALGSNAQFKYPRYFQSAPFGPDSNGVLSEAFFEVA